MRLFFTLYFLYFLSVFAKHANAQELQHFDLPNGLSSTEITSICQNENYLWIATEDGLNRFDGHRFKVYKHDHHNTNSLNNNNIEVIFLDSKGWMWIGYKAGGVDLYNPRTEQFYHLSDYVSAPLPHRVVSIFEDSDHTIWLGSWEEGLFSLTPSIMNAKSEVHYQVKQMYQGRIISGFVEKPDKMLWISTYTGLLAHRLGTDSWKDISVPQSTITQLQDAGDDHSLYYASWNNKLYQVKWEEDPYQAQSTCLYQCDYPIYRLLSDKQQSLMIGTWGAGVIAYQAGDDSINSLNEICKDGTTFINCLFLDREENLWIGTYSKGLYKYSTKHNGIKTLMQAKHHAPISVIVSQTDDIILGTLGDGIYEYSLRNFKESLNWQSSDRIANQILTMVKNEDLILVGHDGQGIQYATLRSDLPPVKWESYTPDNNLGKATAFCFSDNKIWIGTKQDGLMSVKWNKNQKRFYDYTRIPNFGRDRINVIHSIDRYQLLIASHSGLDLYDSKDSIQLKQKIISNEIVYSLVEDKAEHCWWIGTSSRLLRLTLEENGTLLVHPTFIDYPLPQGAVKNLVMDNFGNLWFFIGHRVFCYKARTGMVSEFSLDQQAQLSVLAASCIHRNGKDYMVFANTEQLISIDIAEILQEDDSTRLLLTDLGINYEKVQVGDTIYGSVILKENIEYTSELKLPYKSQWLSLTFTEVGETNYCNKYLYRLNGFSNQWRYLDLSTPLTFSYLPTGCYTLQIKKYGEQAEKSCFQLQITVIPPWWKTSVFYAFMGLLTVVIISVAILLIIHHYRKKNKLIVKRMEEEQKAEVLREKESFIEGLGHDLITPLSLILAPAKDLIRDADPSDSKYERLSIISKNATFLSDLFATILDFKNLKYSEGALQLRTIEVIAFCRLIVNAFQYLAHTKAITLEYAPKVDKAMIEIDSVKFERILYNILSNALKFTPNKGYILVSVDIENNELTVSVKDSGQGIDQKYQKAVFEKFCRGPKLNEEEMPAGLGIGLYVVKTFVDKMKGNIHLQSKRGEGTDISIKLPIKLIEVVDDCETTQSNNEANILLVEDNKDILKYLSSELRTHFQIITATNAEEAMKMAESYLPEIIVSDIMMPGQMNGLDLCKQIKSNPITSDIFVLLLTAKISAEDEFKGYKEGADFYVRKPFDTKVLISQLENILTTRQKRKEQLLNKLISKNEENEGFDTKDVFLQQAMKVIESNIENADFSIDDFALGMNVSKTVLHKKFKALIGQTPNQFIRTIRLRNASDLLIHSDYTIAEVAYLCGFNQAHYFIKCFKEMYGDTPKSFREQRSTGNINKEPE